jgi:tRNA pseudouridine55 synthase
MAVVGRARELEGVLLVDKPADHTSHDVIARLRGKLHMRRIGHAGTLDPMATGLLVVLVGKATSASQYLISLDKEYEGTLRLGISTNSQDADGEVVETRPVPELDAAAVQSTMAGFLGDQYQTPPMYSAVKVGGVPLYKRARKGEEIEREPRFIRVISWDLLRFASPDAEFRLRCTKGTYVRTLAHDLGQKLGCGAHLTSLRRTATDRLRVEQALTLDQIESLSIQEIDSRLLPIRDVVPSPGGPPGRSASAP